MVTTYGSQGLGPAFGAGVRTVAGDGVIYLHDGAGLLATVNPMNGNVTPVGSLGAVFTDIAFAPNGNLFGSTFTQLFLINPDTAQTTLVGNLGQSTNALTFGPDGTLYGSGASGNLFTINPATGQTTVIGPTGFLSSGDLAFHNGVLYLASTSNELVSLDLNTGAGTEIGSFGILNTFALFSDDGILYGVADTQIFEVDPATGAGTGISTYGDQGLGIAFGAAIPGEAGTPNNPPSDILISGTGVREDATNGTLVGQLSALDDIGDTHTFETVNSSGLFTLSGADLVLTGPLDFETSTSHDVMFRATDQDGATLDKTLTIPVIDVDETNPPPPPPPTGDTVDVFRFFNTTAGGHFFTTNEAERDAVLNNLPNFKLEGVGFEAFEAESTVLGADEVYRFFNTQAGGHFFTTNEAERDAVLQNLPHFNFEGVGFKAYEEQVDGTVEVFRFFNTIAGGHFFTTSEAERDAVLQNLPHLNFEGVGFYAFEDSPDIILFQDDFGMT